MEAAGHALAVTFPWHGWPRADLLALAGMAAGVAAVVIAMVPPVSRALRRAFGTAVLRADFPWRRYARWFARTWGVYDNPYLRDREYLNLGDTYVPLSIRAAVTGAETVTDATAVLADDRAGNLVILGDPGSGKSTLLKAHGVGALTGRRAAPMARPRPVVPFFVQLRKLAGTEGQISIFDYLAAEILESGAGMSSSAARRFLRYALRQGQVEVMLDGLDEVPSHRRRAVLQAVAYFKDDKSPDRMSCRARIMITCRQQNFESLQEERQEWLSATDGRECWLMRLGDAQIYSYLDKHRGKFTPPGDPDSFFEAIRASGTLSLHRAPLILAMSVGMYAPRAHFLMPSSMAEFYRKMIRDMLDRRGIRYDPGGAMPLNFHTSDKERFLRRFALRTAAARPGFDEFAKEDLVRFAATLTGDLAGVGDPRAFVEEIIEHSGLLTDVGHGSRYIFAHRSIQEFLTAQGLRETSDGASFLLARADDLAWRQVIQFYSAGLEQHQANAFLPELAVRNPELAGFCLARTEVSDVEAGRVLAALWPTDTAGLAALIAATTSPREPVRRMAVDRLAQVASRGGSPLRLGGGQIDELILLLGALTETDAAQIAWLVPWLIEQVPDDPRLVEPLWRCLAAPGIENFGGCATIVRRLVDLATSPDGFAELARQPPRTRSFLTGDARRRAYPFRRGLPNDHNLVTLLTWANQVRVVPARPNRYFEAKAAGHLDRIETARPQAISFAPFWAVRIFSVALCLGALIAAVVFAATDPGALVNSPFGGTRLIAVIPGAAIVSMSVFTVISARADHMSYDSRLRQFLIFDVKGEYGHTETAFALDWITSSWPIFAMTGVIAVALLPLAEHSWITYFTADAVIGFFYFAPFMNGFSRGRRYYLYQPSPYVDLYDDPRSRHWVSPDQAY